MRKLLSLMLSCMFAATCFSQHTLVTKNAGVLNVKITEIGDSTMTYQVKNGKNTITNTIALSDVESYITKEGITYKVPQPVEIIPQRDTIVSIVKDTVETALLLQYVDNQRKAIASALKMSGIVSLSIGVPCLAGGIASLMYANLVPNPMKLYTTNKNADASAGLEYVSVEVYNEKVRDFTRSTHAAEVAGYILTPMGGALTVVGIPLFVKGKQILDMEITYSGTGAGLTINF